MTPPSPLSSPVAIHAGSVAISAPVLVTWAIMVVLVVGSWLMTRRLAPQASRSQALLELLVTGIEDQIAQIVRKDSRPLVPLLGTLFLFLLAANVSGLLPGVQAPTSRIETPAALALIV